MEKATNIDQNKIEPCPEVFALDSSPFGISYSEWTVRWWQWCLSQPKSTNPATDRLRSHGNAASSQFYPDVWFLAGTTDGFAERECKIPAECAILTPIINFEISTAEDPLLRTDQDLTAYARADVDKIAKVDVFIDGMTLADSKKFRIESRPFNVTLPDDNIWGVKAGPTRAAGDGYWLFLKPLARGEHKIYFGGSCLAGTVNIATSYHITIV